jgi:hypothetical protein
MQSLPKPARFSYDIRRLGVFDRVAPYQDARLIDEIANLGGIRIVEGLVDTLGHRLPVGNAATEVCDD